FPSQASCLISVSRFSRAGPPPGAFDPPPVSAVGDEGARGANPAPAPPLGGWIINGPSPFSEAPHRRPSKVGGATPGTRLTTHVRAPKVTPCHWMSSEWSRY